MNTLSFSNRLKTMGITRTVISLSILIVNIINKKQFNKMPKQQQSYDSLVKILLIGDTGVGKTNILLRYFEDRFSLEHVATIGIDFKTKTVLIDGKQVRLQVWDTAGQQRFKTITQAYYRGAMGIIIIYSVVDRVSFENVKSWIKQIKQHSSNNTVKLLVGNKSDVVKRKVTYEEGEALAKDLNVSFLETSAKNDVNIQACFNQIAQEIKQNSGDQLGVKDKKLKHLKSDTQIFEDKKKCCGK